MKKLNECDQSIPPHNTIGCNASIEFTVNSNRLTDAQIKQRKLANSIIKTAENIVKVCSQQ